MANINETISEVAKLNSELARQIQKYVKDHSYGLVFEHNLPEAVRLYKKQPAIGDTVNILAPRGQKETEENSVPWCVKYIDNGIAYLEHDGEAKDVPLEDICVLVSYRDVIYPGLKEIDRIGRGNPEDPYHMVINSENYHALEALTYAYAGKVDCIYIDPPYNTGAKDWKYNNDYVGQDDQYRHSKWLAFMERRLKLAKQLLNPKDSVLIVTIDEKEYARLGILLEQVFPEAKIQMVTCVISSQGSTRDGLFSRADEYIYFVFLGSAEVVKSEDDMLNEGQSATKSQLWFQFVRTGKGNLRENSKNLFYPIFVNTDKGNIEKIGEPIPLGVPKESVNVPEGLDVIWPMTADGREARWRTGVEVANRRLAKGLLRLGKSSKKAIGYSVLTVNEGTEKRIESGEVEITGLNDDGSANLVERVNSQLRVAKTVWNKVSHNAGWHGSKLLSGMLLDRKFPYPKSLYAVADTLRTVVGNKPDALIIDFFAGSGTTLHAVNLLNAEDGGHRRAICVTNNEVSSDEAQKFTKQNLRQGDDDWEQFGIARYVTWPRTKCSIEGVDVNGKPLKGNYIGSDMPMADGFKANAVFCELTYEAAWPIRLDNAFNAIAPILWMQAGCQGPIIRKIGKSYLTTDYYGVLFDYGQASKFCEKVKNTPTIKTVFVVTDDQRRYSNMCKRLPGIEVHRLYETFLRTFEICGEGGLD
ncbi:DNA methyltransferase [Clostridium sp. AF36-4]|uniref:site-specific DNA-methyltransferase n=1 Tax=Clostridium sp. AF36-4 TaxID=2293015 RepID=UPI0015F33422|nr:DNA methyltransferase [Clostridium sp. AF36-4]